MNRMRVSPVNRDFKNCIAESNADFHWEYHAAGESPGRRGWRQWRPFESPCCGDRLSHRLLPQLGPAGSAHR